MSNAAPTIRAFACRCSDGSPGYDVAYFCLWCEIVHSHRDPDSVTIGGVLNDLAKCWEGSGSPHFGRGVDLKIARLVNELEVTDPRSQWRRNGQPLYRVLSLLRERLIAIVVGALFRVEIADPINHQTIILEFDFEQVDVSYDLSVYWHATHHHTVIAPTDFRKIESRGYDLLSLMSAFSGATIAEIACMISLFFGRDLDLIELDICAVFERWTERRCPHRPGEGRARVGLLQLSEGLRTAGLDLPAFDGKSWSAVLKDILSSLVPVIARATLPDAFADITEGPDLVDALRLIYGLSAGMVLLRLLENITAASLDAQAAVAFVAAIDSGDSIADDDAGTPSAISPAAAAVTRVLTAPKMAKPGNDDLPAGRSVQAFPATDSLVAAIGGDA